MMQQDDVIILTSKKSGNSPEIKVLGSALAKKI
jgi:hypothetical protein